MKVKFVPQNVEFEIKPGQSVLHLAQDHGIYIKSVCKGVPSCAECRVRVTEGEHNVMPPGSEELSLIGSGHFIDRRRLSCQLKCFGDITVDMTEQIAKEQGLIVGRKKKMAAKDDRVEAVVRRSETESGVREDGGEGSELAAEGASAATPLDRPPREARGDGDRDGQRGDRNRDRHRGSRPGSDQQARGGNDRGGRGAGQPNRPSQRGDAPSQNSQRPEGPNGEPREGGGRKRRRRRGKGGGGGGSGGQGPTGSGQPPSRPGSSV